MRTRVSVVAVVMSAVATLSWLTLTTGGSSAAEDSEPAATCAPEGTALAIVAADNEFDKECMAVPAAQAFTIELDNQDNGLPHNVSLYDTADGDKKELFKGEIIYGPSKITYQVPAQAAGTYAFICDPHEEFMKGAFIVG